MDMKFTLEQEMLRKSAREFLAGMPRKLVREMEKDRRGYPPGSEGMAQLGWLGLPFPENCGAPAATSSAWLSSSKRWAAPACRTVLLHGRARRLASWNRHRAQKQAILPKIAKGDLTVALALTEPDGGGTPKA